MIILVCGVFDVYRNGRRTGEQEFVVSHGIQEHTGKHVILPSEHPAKLGAVYDRTIMEWVIMEDGDAAHH